LRYLAIFEKLENPIQEGQRQAVQ